MFDPSGLRLKYPTPPSTPSSVLRPIGSRSRGSQPPPAPPLPPQNNNAVLLKTNRVRSTPNKGDPSSLDQASNDSRGVPLGDVISELKSKYCVNLRKVDGVRSPGGTVQRTPSKEAPQDISTLPTNDLIAYALKQKFKHVEGASPQNTSTIMDEEDDAFE